MEFQVERVEALRRAVRNAIDVLDTLKNTYEQERKVLEHMCPHEEYLAEDDGDCHSSGCYYTCKACKHFTKAKPSNCKITWS